MNVFWKITRSLFCGIAFFSAVSFAQAPTTPRPEGMGTEFGNGKNAIIRALNNVAGLSLFGSYGSWHSSYGGRFTELFASLSDGPPQARLQISTVREDKINTFGDLVDLFLGKAKDWTIADRMVSLEAVKKEVTLGDGRCSMDLRVFKAPKEVVIINLVGEPDCNSESAYSLIKASLDTM